MFGVADDLLVLDIALHSLEVDEDVFDRPFLPTQTAASLCHLVVNVVEADSGTVPLLSRTCRLKNS